MFANRLAQAHEGKAVAILTPQRQGGFIASVRAPDSRPLADAVCREFDSGGGRKTAAGINHLDEAEVERFASRLREAFS